MRERSFTDQIRGAVEACGRSRYRLCAATGIDKGSMSRFMSGGGFLSEQSLNALADAIGLSVAEREPMKAKVNP
jgi:transcriptional regulator with XRE-family HTH domain